MASFPFVRVNPLEFFKLIHKFLSFEAHRKVKQSLFGPPEPHKNDLPENFPPLTFLANRFPSIELLLEHPLQDSQFGSIAMSGVEENFNPVVHEFSLVLLFHDLELL